jgi:hypothetical protein
MTIYLPDDLAEEVKKHADMNVSAICQDALRHELGRLDQVGKLDEGMQRIVIDLGAGPAAFTGRQLPSEHGVDLDVYLTGRRRIAIYDADKLQLDQFDTFDEFAEAYGGLPDLVGDIAAHLGESYIVELDI